jgi:hypothetical protein
MDRLKVLWILFVALALALTMSTAVAQPGGGKPPGQDKEKEKSTEYAVFGKGIDGTADVLSAGPVVVGTDVQTYSPELISLYLSKELVEGTDLTKGWYDGMARVLRRNGPEGGRLDFYFDCSTTDLDSCDYRLIVRFGIYDRKADTVWFDPGEMTLNQRPTEDELGKTLKRGEASFSVKFD